MALAKRKKRFFDVELLLIGRETQLQAYELEELEGRTVKYDLTRMLKGKSVMLTFKVNFDKGKAVTTPTKLEVMPYFLRRMVRKGTNYVEDSFKAECKDSLLTIKPFLVTRRKVSRAVRKALREETKKELENYIKEKNAGELFEELIRNQLQKTLSIRLKKIYPLALCEVRVLEIKK
jgi:ribosomal protein S3AE